MNRAKNAFAYVQAQRKYIFGSVRMAHWQFPACSVSEIGFGETAFMLYNAKKYILNIRDTRMDYITFGKGQKPLVMIQGLNTRGLKGAAVSFAYMYRIFAKDFKVFFLTAGQMFLTGLP